LGKPSPFFSGAKTCKFTVRSMVSFCPIPNSDMHKGRSRKLLRILCDVRATLMGLRQALFWGEPCSIFSGAKKQKNYNGTNNWHFLLFMAALCSRCGHCIFILWSLGQILYDYRQHCPQRNAPVFNLAYSGRF